MIKKFINFIFSKVSKMENINHLYLKRRKEDVYLESLIVGTIREYRQKEQEVFTFFHVSNPKYRDSIEILGLLPKVGDSYRLHYEEFEKGKLEPRIFLSSKNEYDSTYNDDRYMIVLNKAELEYLDLKEDKEVKNGFYTTKPISIENLYLIHKGNGVSEDWDGTNNKLEKGKDISNLRRTNMIRPY